MARSSTACLSILEGAALGWGVSLPRRDRQCAGVQVGALGNVSPAHGRHSELREAVVNPTRYFIGAAGVGEHLDGYFIERLHDRIIELADLYRRVIREHTERGRIVSVVFRQHVAVLCYG